jgi:hypothetical protein
MKVGSRKEGPVPNKQTMIIEDVFSLKLDKASCGELLVFRTSEIFSRFTNFMRLRYLRT